MKIDIKKLKPEGKVVFGSTVVLLDLKSNEEKSYQIVGVDEADLKNNKISVSSPVASALIGKEEGDEVSMNTPGGESEFEILEIHYV